MTRTIFITNLRIMASIGVLPHERKIVQPLVINVELKTNTTEIKNDSIDEVVSYDDIVKKIRKIFSEDHIQLLETACDKICAACFEDARVREAFIKIEKLNLYSDVDSTGATLTRTR